MVRRAERLFLTQISTERMPDAGLFTWDLNSNLVYADSALAELFGLDPVETERGLPVQTYLDRVHPDDAPTLAKQINDAIIAEHPTVQEYRSRKADGSYIHVSAFGRCFRDRNDNPVHYAGIVMATEKAPAGSTH
ncbi:MULTISPECIES: PAS domain-containing protein [unclassified Rhizobium]|uniref:PAS domain-containing protein n=1 Tax=unclassified Rhizobium TaxID=2613769 RepID=UPI0016200E0D|nr:MULTISPECIES: PAS domain-containing protein [unclassified Rhizobium]MBB3543862.1 PAS domain S-box-containing protein [Rhizobium sp. BK399]MCS4094088.1 PAS domain S-box-containing protein [Rhizobium sp. BK176]